MISKQHLFCAILFSGVALMFSQSIEAKNPSRPSVLISENFEGDIDAGLMGKLLLNKNITLAKGKGRIGSNGIRVAYVGYERGSQRVLLKYPLGVKIRQATLSFDVQFDKDFQWVRGGKLHGLGPARPVTGGRPRQTDGWSARVTFTSKGYVKSYLYDQDPKVKYGVSKMSAGPVFTAGKWHHVSLHVALNDPGKPNGFVRIKIDGKEVIHAQNVNFRGEDGPDTLIQQFLFSTFHGGHAPGFAPVDSEGKFVTVYAYYDNFLVVEGAK